MPTVRVTPSGTRLMLSTPPATTTSLAPHMTACAAKSRACWLEPQARLTVVPGMLSGQSAASTANRAMLLDWSPIWDTQPQMTSSTRAGSSPARLAISVSTSADRSTGCTPASPPPRLPTGVRTASTITASRIAASFALRSILTAVQLAHQSREPLQRRQLLVGGGTGRLGPDRGDARGAERPEPVADHVVGADKRRKPGHVVRHRLHRLVAPPRQPQLLDGQRLGF